MNAVKPGLAAAAAVMCPVCRHPMRRHTALGCTAAGGTCECVGTVDEPAAAPVEAAPAGVVVDLLDPVCGCGHRRTRHGPAGSAVPCRDCACRHYTAPADTAGAARDHTDGLGLPPLPPRWLAPLSVPFSGPELPDIEDEVADELERLDGGRRRPPSREAIAAVAQILDDLLDPPPAPSTVEGTRAAATPSEPEAPATAGTPAPAAAPAAPLEQSAVEPADAPEPAPEPVAAPKRPRRKPTPSGSALVAAPIPGPEAGADEAVTAATSPAAVTVPPADLGFAVAIRAALEVYPAYYCRSCQRRPWAPGKCIKCNKPLVPVHVLVIPRGTS